MAAYGGMTALWVQALWPILVFAGGMLWYGGRHRGLAEAIRDRLGELQSDQRLAERAVASSTERLDRLDLRLTATETNVTNQGRILDRIEGKLDRLIEVRSDVRR